VADYSIIVAKNTLTLNYPTKMVLETVAILKRCRSLPLPSYL
jgi:hypothetical protein